MPGMHEQESRAPLEQPDSLSGTSWKSPQVAASVLLALCLVLFLKPYYGIHHDSVLYLGQALLRWQPEQLGHDLFFAYGSQAEFSLFPPMVGWLLRYFSASEIFLAIALAGRLGFMAASYFLARRLLPEGYRFWALLAILVMPSGYGGYNVYSYGESFATSRILAEPLVLLALGAAVRRQWLWAGAAWLLAFSLHPLQALPGALLIWVLLLSRDRRWLHLLWPLAAVLLLSVIDVGLPASIAGRYDDQWWGWVLVDNKPVFLLQWQLSDWCYLLTDAFLVLLVARGANASLRLFARALLLTVLIAFSASMLLSDVLHMVLPAGLQFWRAQWLLHWFAMGTLPWQLLRLHAAGPGERLRLLLLLAIAVVGARQLPTPGAVLILIPLYFVWPRLRDRIRPALGNLLAAAILLSLAIIYVKLTFVAGADMTKGFSRELLRPEFMLVSQPPVMAALVVLGLWSWHRGPRGSRAGLLVLLAAWLAYASLGWDRRSPAMRDIEAAQGASSPFGVQLESGAQVLWVKEVHFEELLATWLVLNRPSYFSPTQKAGLLFNRGTAQEAMARQRVAYLLEKQDSACGSLIAASIPAEACLPDYREAIRNACETERGKLDYVVMNYDLGLGVLGRWPISVERKGDQLVTSYLYRCNDFRSAVSGAAPSAPAGHSR